MVQVPGALAYIISPDDEMSFGPVKEDFSFLKMTALIVWVFSFLMVVTLECQANEDTSKENFTEWDFLYYEEGWTLEDFKKEDGGFIEKLKKFPLKEDKSIQAGFGGELRLRIENWGDFNFTPENDDTFVLTRLLVNTEIQIEKFGRIYVQGKSAHSTGRELPGGNRPGDADEFEFQQGFLDLSTSLGEDYDFTIRLGRRSFTKGNQRLVSPSPWGNSLRHWDGVSGIFKTSKWDIEAFWTYFSPVKRFGFNDPDVNNRFAGIYGSGRFFNGAIDLDFYWLSIEQNNKTINGTSGDENRETVGARLSRKFLNGRFELDIEGAYQFGEIGSNNINAYMVAGQLGYQEAHWAWPSRFFIGIDYASGDDQPGGDVETFNQIFPLGHAYLGYMDFVGRQNSIDFSHGLMTKPNKKLTLSLVGHQFWLAKNGDSLYNSGANPIRSSSNDTSNTIGYEIDTIAKYQFNKYLTGLAGYSHFFSGKFLKETGSAQDVDFFYFQTAFNF